MLTVVQITLDVVALVDLYRRPVEQVVFANKWLWVAVVLLVSTIGAIIYLVAARKPEVLPESSAPSPSPVRAEDVAETLYGPRDSTDPR